MIVNIKHGCGEVIPVPCADELDAYTNPAWCATCGRKFFPKPPPAKSSEQKKQESATLEETVEETLDGKTEPAG